MKNSLLAGLFLAIFSLTAQRKIEPTDTLKIIGKIKKELTFTLQVLDTFTKINIQNIVIQNHKGEIKDTITGLKGFLLKDILIKLEFQVQKPNELNGFYFKKTRIN